MKLSILNLRAGRSKDIMGLCDSDIVCRVIFGSGNSLGVPQIGISIPEYFTDPVLVISLHSRGTFPMAG